MNTHRKMNRYMFTASQLEELQHQVLIFKYMASGVQVPSHLLLNLTTSLDSTTRLFPHKQGFAAGLGLFHMGFSRKEVSEPGRCKRTDGKKWRCSKETHLDSKYCERHMHRGRNSSRKPVEIYATATTTTTKPITEIHSDSVPDCSFLQSSTLLHPASLLPPSSSRPPTTSSLSPRSSTTQQFLPESGSSYSQINNYRYLHATRDGETAFSMKVPETVRYQQESYLPSQIAYSDYFCHLKDHAKSEYQQRRDKKDLQQHCFILGDDFKPAKTIKLDRGGDNPKRFHHFFSECPLKSKDPWFDNDQQNHGSVSNTQFSTSTPFSTQELFQPKPRPFKY